MISRGVRVFLIPRLIATDIAYSYDISSVLAPRSPRMPYSGIMYHKYPKMPLKGSSKPVDDGVSFEGL